MVKASTFGSEFVALCIATVLVQGLRCELRMMDVPLDGPTSMYCDNVSVTRMHRYHNLLYCAITKSDRVWRPDGFRSCGLYLEQFGESVHGSVEWSELSGFDTAYVDAVVQVDGVIDGNGV